MKYNYIILALAPLTLFSCMGNKVETPSDEGELITIRAYQEGASETRTTLIDGGTQVYWEPSDEIKVFFNGTGGRFATQITENATVATFSGTLNVIVGGTEGAGFSTKTWGLYPYRADAVLDGEAMVTTLPASQTGRAGSFAKNTNITLAQSEGYGLSFYNVCGGIRFSLTQEGVKEVVFQGQNEEDIAGKVKLAFVDGVPTVQEITEGQKTITLSAPNNGTFETGKWYYIVALPGTLSNGFKMTFNTETQYATLKSSGSKTIKRGTFGSLADADEDLIYKDRGGEEPPTGNIVFADLAAKYACVAKYDTNGDGEVSVEEAEAATSFDGLFTDWKGVESFDEIRYFKNVHSLNGVFNGCDKLASITIPDNITDLGTNAFNGCSLLESVELPSGITAIGNYTFQNCSSLTAIDIPSTVTSVGQYAFSDCSALASVELPSGLTSISNFLFQNCSKLSSVGIPSGVTSVGSYAFSGCSSLGSVDLPANLKTIAQYAFANSGLTQIAVPDDVTSLGSYVFSGCSKLTIATLPAGISSIPAYCFNNCSSLTSVTVPAGISTVGNNAFAGVKMWKLDLPSTVSSLGSSCFGSFTCVIMRSTSPVSIQSDTFGNIYGIFVPSNLIAMYGVMTNWANYSSKLHPIDTYKDKNEFTLATSSAVDMGTSVKWAAYNLGATKPEEYGGYYAWGETQTKSEYNWNIYKWCNGDYDKLTKYCQTDKTDYWDGEGTPDGKTVLDLEDDAARANWGGTWRMPTDEEWTELRTGCFWEWTTYEGTYGYKVFGFESGNIIFLPAAGVRYGSSLRNAGSYGYYWSSSLETDYPDYAWDMHYSSNAAFRGGNLRYRGASVRPVCPKD